MLTRKTSLVVSSGTVGSPEAAVGVAYPSAGSSPREDYANPNSGVGSDKRERMADVEVNSFDLLCRPLLM